MVRSRVAHGVLEGIDTTAARNMPGVLGVYTGADLARYGTLKCVVPFNNRDGTPMIQPPRPALAHRQGTLGRRPRSLHRRRDAAAGEGCRRGGRGRHRCASRRGAAGRGGATGCAADPRTGARQRRARLSLWRQRRGRCRVRQGGARHAPASWSTAGWWSTRWSRARRSASTSRRADASRCTPRRRECSGCGATWRRSSRSSRSRFAS